MATPERAIQAPKTILVYVGLDRVGDGLLKLPFVRGLRQAYPDAHITWLAGKETSVFASVLKPLVDGVINEVIEYGGIGLSPWEVLRRPLKGRSFDLIFDTQRIFWTSLSLWRVKHKTFISPAGKFFLSSKKPPADYKRPRAMQREILDLLEIATGQTFPTPKKLDLPTDPAMIAAAQDLLPEGPTYIAIAPGSGGKPKCWPLSRFVQLAREQADKGRVPVILLGPQEPEWQKDFQDAVPQALFPLQTDAAGPFGFSPLLTIALAARARLCVANDSGVGHMMAISETPLVSLFGTTVAEKFMPMSDNLTIIRAADFGGREMVDIPYEAVSGAVDAAL